MRDATTVEETLFIHNDNASQLLDKQDGRAGGGNEVVRPLRLSGDACGIPTGLGGFGSLDEHIDSATDRTVRQLIDTAFEEVRETLHVKARKVRVLYCGVILP